MRALDLPLAAVSIHPHKGLTRGRPQNLNASLHRRPASEQNDIRGDVVGGFFAVHQQPGITAIGTDADQHSTRCRQPFQLTTGGIQFRRQADSGHLKFFGKLERRSALGESKSPTLCTFLVSCQGTCCDEESASEQENGCAHLQTTRMTS